jgi:hypothetical protein
MFGSNDPADVDYYSAQSAYGKTVLRQAMATDVHPHRVVSSRIVMDTAMLRNFAEQDSRIEGEQWQRFDRRFQRGSNELMQAFYIVPEAVSEEQDVDAVAELLVDRDKRAKKE